MSLLAIRATEAYPAFQKHQGLLMEARLLDFSPALVQTRRLLLFPPSTDGCPQGCLLQKPERLPRWNKRMRLRD